MKIGIDMLPLKTASFTRGIGKYTFNLITKLIDIDGSNLYYLYNVPNELFFELENKNVTIFEREPKISDSSQMDVFIITSFMELEKDINLIPSKMECKTVLIFYDLIPVIFWDNYLQGPSESYFRRLSYVKDFDLILAISKTTKNDLIELLEVPEEKVNVIYGGLDENYFINKNNDEEIKLIKKKYNIPDKFLLSTPGIDFRKNISGMFDAYSYLPNELKESLTFVLVCKLKSHEEEHLRNMWSNLGLPNGKLVLTNYIPVKDLIGLYDVADIFVFPSLYEGFGLPVLEAMSRGCPVVTSDVSSLPEVCESAAIYVNPMDSQEIATAIEKIYTNEYLRSKLVTFGLDQYKKFSWDKVAIRTKISLDSLFPETKVANIKKDKIAFFTPLNPIKSGISDYSEDLLPTLNKFVDIDVFIDENYVPKNKDLKNTMNIYSHDLFERMHDKYDLCIYQFGNSKYHAYMYDHFLKHPGIAVFHDLTLHGLVAPYFCVNDGIFQKEKYLEYIFKNHGYDKYLQVNDNLKSNGNLDFFDMSLNFAKDVIDSNILTLLHSDFSKKILDNQISFCNVSKINMGFPIDEFTLEDKNKLKTNFGFSNEIIISAFGRITNTKRIDVLLNSFSNLVNEWEILNVRLVLVGEICDDVKDLVYGIIKERNIRDKVTVTGHVSNEEFDNYYKVTDVCVNLRYPTSGETSATLTKALSYNIPTITTNYAQYKEYPNNCCWKVDLGDFEIELLSEYLFELIRNDKLREKMSDNAYEYAKQNISIEQTVKQYLRAIDYAINYRTLI